MKTFKHFVIGLTLVVALVGNAFAATAEELRAIAQRVQAGQNLLVAQRQQLAAHGEIADLNGLINNKGYVAVANRDAVIAALNTEADRLENPAPVVENPAPVDNINVINQVDQNPFDVNNFQDNDNNNNLPMVVYNPPVFPIDKALDPQEPVKKNLVAKIKSMCPSLENSTIAITSLASPLVFPGLEYMTEVVSIALEQGANGYVVGGSLVAGGVALVTFVTVKAAAAGIKKAAKAVVKVSKKRGREEDELDREEMQVKRGAWNEYWFGFDELSDSDDSENEDYGDDVV